MQGYPPGSIQYMRRLWVHKEVPYSVCGVKPMCASLFVVLCLWLKDIVEDTVVVGVDWHCGRLSHCLQY